MTVTINGTDKQTSAATVAELVTELGMAERAVAVEVNRQIVPKRQHDQTALRDGDQVEVVTLVGGG